MRIEDLELADAMERCKNSSGQALLYFYNPSLSGCLAFARLLAEMKESSLQVFRVDVSLEPELQVKFPAQELPALYFFSQGLPMGRKPVFQTVSEFESWLKFLEGLC
ncbi:hypothetical protein EBU99_02220 [bacterium]|nr:hypothetical protein [bacterium]